MTEGTCTAAALLSGLVWMVLCGRSLADDLKPLYGRPNRDADDREVPAAARFDLAQSGESSRGAM